MVEVVPFEPKHILDFKNRDTGDYDDWRLFLYMGAGTAFTLLEDGRAIGCAGVVVVPSAKRGLAWAVFGDRVPRYGIMVTRTVRRALKDLSRLHGLENIEMTVYTNTDKEINRRNREWARALGFHEIGTMTRFVRY